MRAQEYGAPGGMYMRDRIEIQADVFEGMVGRLVSFTLADGTRIKGDLVEIRDGVGEVHSLRNVHFVSLGDVMRASVGKSNGGVSQ